MDKCREAFERFECEKYEANYDDMKKNWDWYESQFGYRYSPESLRGKDWAVWQKAWQHQQAKVEGLQKQLIDQGQRFNEQAQIVKDLEHKNGELQRRNQMLSDSTLEMGSKHIRDTDLINQQASTLFSLREFIYGSGDLRKYSDEELLEHQRILKVILAGEQALKGEG